MNILSQRAIQGIDRLAMKAAQESYETGHDVANPFHCDSCKDRWQETYHDSLHKLMQTPLGIVLSIMELPMFMNQAS